MSWSQTIPLAILALTGPPSLAVLWGVMITEKWPWEK